MRRHTSTAVIILALFGMAGTALVAAPPASAEPTTQVKAKAQAGPVTTVVYPKRATATGYRGAAFDTCTAPSLGAMTAWTASPYRAIGVYLGGPNRSCAQPNLTPQWVAGVTGLGWRLLPTYMGLQAPCTDRLKASKITPSKAVAQGKASADDAMNLMFSLGLQAGSTVYADMESYTPTVESCRVAVLKYLSGFTAELHSHGFLSGVYVNLGSGATHLAAAYPATLYARPDVLWVARWDGVASSSFAGVAKTSWPTHQRVKQYLGDHDETYNGVTINIDSNLVDAPVATVAQPHFITHDTSARTAPAKPSRLAGRLSPGTQVQVMCQTPGVKAGGTKVWDKLSTGAYVSDAFVDTPTKPGFSSAVPHCYYPYQVKPATGTIMRSGAGNTYAKKGTLYGGALAWIYCQKPAHRKTHSTKIWDRLSNGSYVSDYYVATASKKTYTSPIPRC